MRPELLYVQEYVLCKSMDTDVILTAFWYPHGYWILLVLRLHHRDCACCMYKSRSKLSHWIEVWPANGAGKSTSCSPLSPLTLTQEIRSTLTQ